MPELPEIETIRRDLEKALLGDRAVSVEVFDRRLMNQRMEAQWKEALVGHPWRAFERKGKYLWIVLGNKRRLEFHMRMTGQLIVHASPKTEKARLLICFASGKRLGLFDQRRFAEAWLLPEGDFSHSKNKLGPDALTELERDAFIDMIKKRTTRIQPLLMDQRLISGVGNIYAQEALFKAAIRPTRSGSRITKTEASRLYDTLTETLQTAVDYRGSSSRNYRDANGDEGSAQNLHAVYRKGGEPCPRCGRPLKAARVGGRGTVFCLQCQK